MVILLLISILGISPSLGFLGAGNWQRKSQHHEVEELVQQPIYSNVSASSSDLDGCLRSGVHYADGANVPSDELCQDCVCSAGEVTCIMQSCRSARYNCRPVGFVKGTCCPLKFECDDEINILVQEIPFSNSEVKTFRNTPSAKSCTSNGIKYFSGQAMPVFSPCQLSCACVDGTVACTQSACPPPLPDFLGCSKLEEPNECCPTYSCPSTPNTKQTLGCMYKGITYDEREYVPSSDLCLECYCKDSEVVCASQKCPDPPAPNCRPLTSSHETCCPQKYECLALDFPEDIDTTESTVTTEDPYKNMATDCCGTPIETTPEVTAPEVTTLEPIISEITVSENTYYTQEEDLSLTTVSLENEPTTLANIEENMDSTTDIKHTTISKSENEFTTVSNSDETTIETTASSTISIEQTTTDEVTTDEVTTELPSRYSTVTENEMATETTTVVFDENCFNDGILYSDGESIPPTSQCQESCHCRNGTVACIEKACSPAPPAFLRCASVEVIDDSDECCPTYDCPPISHGQESDACVRDGTQYNEGEFVPSPDLCTDCYCLYGEILCAFLECSLPVRDSCAPIYDVYDDESRACCPQHYECDMDSDVQTTTMYQTTEEPEASTEIPLFRFAL